VDPGRALEDDEELMAGGTLLDEHVPGREPVQRGVDGDHAELGLRACREQGHGSELLELGRVVLHVVSSIWW
jgi:hypothetical protein